MDVIKLFSRYKADISREYVELTIDEQLELLREETVAGRMAVLNAMLPNIMVYVGRLSHGWDLNEDERMDLLQAGNLGALMALKSFDPDHEDRVYPWTWAKLYVKRQVIREGNLIHTGRASGGDWLFADLDDSDDFSMVMQDERFLSDAAEPHDRVEVEEMLALIAYLPDEDVAVLNAAFWEGATMAAIGEELGVSSAAAHKRVQRAVARLREMLG